MSLCKNCFDQCGDNVISDKCVTYTGPDISFLNIKQGDQLSALEAAIVAQLQTILDGSGIILSPTTSCASIDSQLVGKSKSVANYVQALISLSCNLRADVVALQAQVAPPTSFNTACLTLPTNPTRDQILQALTTLLCSTKATVDTIAGDYVTSATVCALVQECLESSSVQEHTKMPKYCPIPYYGPLSVFDGSGKGLLAFGYDKVYLCVGQTVNGFVIPDLRGRTVIGANVGMPGGTLDSAVDPGLIANAGYNIAKGTKVGEYTHTLNTTETPAHTHGITDPGHKHQVPLGSDSASGNNFANFAKLDSGTNPRATTVEKTNITVNSSGGSQAHNNTQPSLGTYFIIYIP